MAIFKRVSDFPNVFQQNVNLPNVGCPFAKTTFAKDINLINLIAEEQATFIITKQNVKVFKAVDICKF